MKKYILLSLLFFPLASFAAPSVRMLGSGSAPKASAGVKTSVATKVTPAKVGRTASAGNVARIGSMQVKPVSATNSNTSSSVAGSRFPIIIPTKVYNSVNSPRPVGGNTTSITNNNVDMVCGEKGVCETLSEHADSISENVQNITKNADNIELHDGRITTNEQDIKVLQDDLDTIAVGNRDKFSGAPADNTRAWIWVEEISE